MKIYIASRFTDRKRLRPIADRLWHMGHEIVSTWLGEISKQPWMTHEEFWGRLADKDIQELFSADILIRDIHDISRTGGADTEWGLSLSRGQHQLRWLIGKPRNVFHMKADKVFQNWNEVFKVLDKMPKNPPTES